MGTSFIRLCLFLGRNEFEGAKEGISNSGGCQAPGFPPLQTLIRLGCLDISRK